MMQIFLTVVCVLSHIFTATSEVSRESILQKLVELENGMHELKLENQKMKLQNEMMISENMRIEDDCEKLKTGRKKSRRLDESTASKIEDIRGAMDHMWLLICGTLVMLMQAGFAMVESGCCRSKNVQSILLKNLVDVCMGTICWWACGWTLAYGFDATKKNEEVFAGHLQYFGHEFLEADSHGNQHVNGNVPRDWFFQWAFCATAGTIVSGGVAERIQFPIYLVYTVCMTSFIYPVVVAWMWSSNGWLTAGGDKHLNEVGFNDFAGSGIVHMTGGVGALVGAAISGPRKGRFDYDGKESFDPHNLPFVVLGTFVLWFGWYGFNCGSTLGLSTTSAGQLAAVVAMNTTIAASSAGLVVLALRFAIWRKYDIAGMCNGILAGLVSITAGCGNVECGSALFIGIIGGIVYEVASNLLTKLKIDDPIDAFPVHGACGAWGVLAACLFDWGKGFDRYNGFGGGFENAADANGNKDDLWKSGFAAAIVEILVIIAWVAGWSIVILLPFRLAGWLRLSDDIQEQGIDDAKHSPTKGYTGDSTEPRPSMTGVLPAFTSSEHGEPTKVTALTRNPSK